MVGSHAHKHRHTAVEISTARGPVIALFGFLAACAAATIVGVVALWPDAATVDDLRGQAMFAAPGVSFVEAEAIAVQPACPPTGTDESGGPPQDTPAECGKVNARLTEGPERGAVKVVDVPAPVVRAGLKPGDTVRLVRNETTEGPVIYTFDGVNRMPTLWLMTGLFVLVVFLVARLRGLLALVGLGFGGLVLLKFMLPALLSGSSGLAVGLTGSAAIMFVVLYLAHGPSVRTSTALAGTLVGVGLIAAAGEWAVHAARLTGLSDEGSLLSAFAVDLSFQGLLTCALIVAGLGVLNDVTITQSSAIWELRAAAPEQSRPALFSSAMRIGRDHIASTIYTIVFAYAGAALAVLLLLVLYDRPLLDLLTTESISEEIVRTLAGAIGLVLAVPITTAIAASTMAGTTRPQVEDEDADTRAMRG